MIGELFATLAIFTLFSFILCVTSAISLFAIVAIHHLVCIAPLVFEVLCQEVEIGY